MEKVVLAIRQLPVQGKIICMLVSCVLMAFVIQAVIELRERIKRDSDKKDRKKRTTFVCFILLFFCAILQASFTFVANFTSSYIYEVTMGKGGNIFGMRTGEYYDVTQKDADYRENVVEPGWGNSGEPRKVYALSEVNEGILEDRVVLNSITDSVIGDERAFVGIREYIEKNEADSNKWSNDIEVEEGKEYIVRIYAHNDNPGGLNAIAKDTTIHVTMPLESGKQLLLQGSIDSTNAIPSRYYYQVVFRSEREFYLDYVEGSILYENNGIGSEGGVKLSDDLITSNGVKIGYEELDGNIPGGYKYDSYTSFRVRPVFIE